MIDMITPAISDNGITQIAVMLNMPKKAIRIATKREKKPPIMVPLFVEQEMNNAMKNSTNKGATTKFETLITTSKRFPET